MTDSVPLRFAVIGAGASIYRFMHWPAQVAEGIQVVAACDANAETGRPQAEAMGCDFYEDYRTLLAEVSPDVVVITTPHPLHAAHGDRLPARRVPRAAGETDGGRRIGSGPHHRRGRWRRGAFSRSTSSSGFALSSSGRGR